MRRSRVKLRFNALLTASGLSGFILVLTFFFYDGPIKAPAIMPTAMATEDSIKTMLTAASSTPENRPPVFATHSQPEWAQISLDQDLVKLKVLKAPLTLAQTTQKAGSEAFDYAAYLYSQMAQEIQDTELSTHLKRLSIEAQALGQSLRQASQIRFDGPPSNDMGHLQIRTAILDHLNVLNQGALITARYNQQGTLLNEEQGSFSAGKGFTNYLATLNQIKTHPAAQQYPETLALITQESELLGQLSKNLTLRWESTMECPHHCQDIATFMRIYLRQGLPEQTLVSARL